MQNRSLFGASPVARRTFLLMVGATLAAACSPSQPAAAPQPTSAARPQPTSAPAQPQTTASPAAAAPAQVSRPAKDTVIVGIYGGNTEQALKKGFADELQKRYGLKIQTVGANNEQRLAQLKTQRDNPQMDVAWFTDPILPEVVASGVTEKIDTSRLSNFKDTYQSLQPKDGAWVVHGITPWGIAYNADRVKPAPSSWRDLMDPRFKDHVTASDITFSSTYLTLVAMARLDGGSERNLEPGFKNMKVVRDNSPTFWATVDQLNTMLKQEEVYLSPIASGNTNVLAVNQKLEQFRFAAPREGAYTVNLVMTLVKNAPNPEGAYQFMDVALDPAGQAVYAAGTFYAPVNSKTQMPPDLAPRFIAAEDVEKLQTVDWAYLNQQKDAITDRWQKDIR